MTGGDFWGEAEVKVCKSRAMQLHRLYYDRHPDVHPCRRRGTDVIRRPGAPTSLNSTPQPSHLGRFFGRTGAAIFFACEHGDRDVAARGLLGVRLSQNYVRVLVRTTRDYNLASSRVFDDG